MLPSFSLQYFFFTADTQMATILELWPFLFKQPWLGNHFQKLTGQILDQALYGWRETHAQSFMLYLCSSATAATEEAMISNVAERLRWENDGRKSTSMMLLILKMISNHFHEANGFKTLILTKEVRKTMIIRYELLQECFLPWWYFNYS